MQSKLIKTTVAILAAVFAFLLLFSGSSVFAATSSYSSALDDLSRDESFDAKDYPKNNRDYSLNVIQIAESDERELFVYAYQPAADYDFRATSINIATTPNGEGRYDNYTLKYLNNNSTIYKYKVNGLTVSDESERYYEIISIYRKWFSGLDNPAGDNTVKEVDFKVGQYWYVSGEGSNINYVKNVKEVIEVTEKYVGYVSYEDGSKIGWTIAAGVTAAHFVAFNTDRPIDKLISADLQFVERTVTCKYCNNAVHVNHPYKSFFDYSYGERVKHEPLTVKYSQRGENGTNSFKNNTPYTWNRIRSTEQFLAEENNENYKLTDGTEEGLKGTKWVLSFYETPFYASMNGNWATLITPWAALFTGDIDVKKTEVSEVSILRLAFETEGEYYDLGVVDNKQTGSGISGNQPNIPSGFFAWLADLLGVPEWAAILIFVAVVLVVVAAVCTPLAIIFPTFRKVMTVILAIIFLPFTLIYYLIKGIAKTAERRRSSGKTKAAKTKRTKAPTKRKSTRSTKKAVKK